MPYEFHAPERLPPLDAIEMEPPPGFPRSYAHIAPGTWSDDGAQALCLAESLLECGHFHAGDFANRLRRWRNVGYWAVGGYVFDIGVQTGRALDRLDRGHTLADCGLRSQRNNGNGSLMRCLPLALLHRGGIPTLVECAHRQSMITHAHPISLACCALYVLLARILARDPTVPPEDAWHRAVATLRDLYADTPRLSEALEAHIRPEADYPIGGTGYVVDTLHSARWALRTGESYEHTVRLAISLGHDTDTTACVAGGLAALRWGAHTIPARWLDALCGRDLLNPLLQRLDP